MPKEGSAYKHKWDADINVLYWPILIINRTPEILDLIL